MIRLREKTTATLLIAIFMISTFAIVIPVSAAPTIDGVIGTGEWDAYYLGTSVTNWGGGMSVDVYGFADDTYLYAAYIADMNQPGWSTADSLGISGNFDFKAPQSVSWPDSGYTHISIYGDGFAQTDGSGWNWPDGWANTDPSVFTSRGIEYYIGHPMWNFVPSPNVAELKIPLSLLTYAGDDGQIRLSGQYWQYDGATPFYVALPPPPPLYWFKASGGGVSYSDAPETRGNFITLGVMGISLEPSTGMGELVSSKGSGTFIDHNQKIKLSFDIVEGGIMRSDNMIWFYGTAKIFDIEAHIKYTNIPFRLALVDDQYGSTNRFDVLTWGDFPMHWHGTLEPESEVTVWVWE